MADPRRLFDAKDIEAAALYANRITGGAEDFYPLKVDSDGYLLISMTVGSVSLSSTASTITNAVGNPVNVALTSTKVTVEAAGLNVNIASATLGTVTISGNVNVATATLGTVTVTGTVTPSTTASTITNAVGNPVNVSLTNTAVTAALSTTTTTSHIVAGQSGVAAGVGATGTNVLRFVEASDAGRTLTGATGSISATWTSIFTPTNKAKIYAFSFTTTSASEVTVLICDGVFANAKEKWRATLMAPSGANSGANLAVTPPAYLFSSRSASAVTISLSTAVLVHYSLSFFDEA